MGTYGEAWPWGGFYFHVFRPHTMIISLYRGESRSGKGWCSRPWRTLPTRGPNCTGARVSDSGGSAAAPCTPFHSESPPLLFIIVSKCPQTFIAHLPQSRPWASCDNWMQRNDVPSLSNLKIKLGKQSSKAHEKFKVILFNIILKKYCVRVRGKHVIIWMERNLHRKKTSPGTCWTPHVSGMNLQSALKERGEISKKMTDTNRRWERRVDYFSKDSWWVTEKS